MQPCLHIKETREVAANSATGRLSNLQFKVDNRYLELNEYYSHVHMYQGLDLGESKGCLLYL